MKAKIAILEGDGIGPEVVAGALEVLQVIGEKYGHEFTYEYGKIGGIAIDEEGTPLPDETVKLCRESDAILLGAVGGSKWDNNPPDLRPEKGLLSLREQLQLYANLRPTNYYESLADSSPLKRQFVEGVDMLIVRELTGGIYFGQPRERFLKDGREAVVDTLLYEREEIERIIELAFQLAEKRDKKLTSVDKANVLESSRVWREVAEEIAPKYPNVKLEHMLVDSTAMQLIRNPKQFDVIVTENMFGDILSDEASVLTGSLGMLPSASISVSGVYLYEPIHGSAPDIAGQQIANPIGTILSLAMMLRHSFQLEEEAAAIEQAVRDVLDQGYRTADIYTENTNRVTTNEMVGHIKEAISKIN